MEVSVQCGRVGSTLRYFPRVRASGALTAAILRRTGKYPSRNGRCEPSYTEDERPLLHMVGAANRVTRRMSALSFTWWAL